MAYGGQLGAGTTYDNFHEVLSAVGWPMSERIVYGAPAAYRSAGGEPQQAWPALLRVARAELGTVFPDRQGRIAFRCRGIDLTAIDLLPVVGCEGADLDDVTSLVARSAIVDHVLIEPDDVFLAPAHYEDTIAVQSYGRRTLRAKRDELRLALAP